MAQANGDKRKEPPALIIDEDLSASAADGMRSIDALIRENPSIATTVINLYAKDADAGDQWLKLLTDSDSTERYPFRLTSALGVTATRATMRYISYDPTTRKKIDEDDEQTKLFQKLRSGAQTNDEALTRAIGLHGLSIYAGEIAAAIAVEQTQNAPQDQGKSLRSAG